MLARSLVRLALVAVPVAVAAACAPAAVAQQPVPPPGQPTPAATSVPVGMAPSVVTTGHGETKIAPDRATVSVTVETHGATAAQASAENARLQTATIAALRNAGLDAKDISTSGYMVNPEYQYLPNTKPRVTGYAARNTVTADVKKIDLVGKVIDAAIAGGANTIGGVQFYASNTDEARRTALADAVRQACLDANAMAKAVGAVAGDAVEISTQIYQPPRPMMEPAMLQASRMAADVPTPISPGDLTISATVVARWPMTYSGGGRAAKCE